MLGQILPRAAARHGDKPALVTDSRTLSYTDLDALSDRVAAALAARDRGEHQPGGCPVAIQVRDPRIHCWMLASTGRWRVAVQ